MFHIVYIVQVPKLVSKYNSLVLDEDRIRMYELLDEQQTI